MTKQNSKLPAFPIGKILLIVGIFIILALSVYTIPAGKRGIVVTFGNPSDVVMTEGIHFKIPIAQQIVKVDVKTQKYEASASSSSKDLQVVSTNVAVNYHLTAASVSTLYKSIGLNYESKIIQPSVQEVVKAVTAQFTAEELITKRSEVKEKIELQLEEKLMDRYMEVESVSITDFQFSTSFNDAIEAKVTAEQNALQAKNVLEQKKYEAEQIIVTADATAQAIKIQAEAIESQGGEAYVQLQAINKWDGVLPIVTGSSMPIINLDLLGTNSTA